MVRRALSIILYVLGGLCLLGEGTTAFIRIEPDLPNGKLVMMAVMAPFYLIPLGLGVLASPGARLRELGIVLMATAGWLTFTAGMVAYAAVMPDTRRMLPPNTLDMFGDYAFGAANLVAMAGLGFVLFRYGRQAGGAPAA